jgi:hypothetical protein
MKNQEPHNKSKYTYLNEPIEIIDSIKAGSFPEQVRIRFNDGFDMWCFKEDLKHS